MFLLSQGYQLQKCDGRKRRFPLLARLVPLFLTLYRILTCAPLSTDTGEAETLYTVRFGRSAVSAADPVPRITTLSSAMILASVSLLNRSNKLKADGRVAVMRMVVFSPRCCSLRVTVL